MLIMDCEVTSDMKWDEFTTSCDIRKWSGFVILSRKDLINYYSIIKGIGKMKCNREIRIS